MGIVLELIAISFALAWIGSNLSEINKSLKKLVDKDKE